ncbi:MAG: hypothetical protein H7X94_12150 [Vallitaleaceae bacterium]|nr:hypothetical protein [Vallitaleaceae bacterium]
MYKIYNAKIPLPQNNRFAAYFYYPLDLAAMQKACPYFLGTHDFFAFSSAGGNVKTSIRTLRTCEVFEKDGLFEFRVTGNSFLYNMVRVIVGTLMEVGTGRMQAEDIPAIFDSKDRERSGNKAPAKGLTLVEIKYK